MWPARRLAASVKQKKGELGGAGNCREHKKAGSGSKVRGGGWVIYYACVRVHVYVCRLDVCGEHSDGRKHQSLAGT